MTGGDCRSDFEWKRCVGNHADRSWKVALLSGSGTSDVWDHDRSITADFIDDRSGEGTE